MNQGASGGGIDPTSPYPLPATRSHAKQEPAVVTKSRTEYCVPVAMTKSLRRVLLQHQPLRTNVVARMPQSRRESNFAQVQRVLQTDLDARQGACDFARHESLARMGDSWLKRMPLQAYSP